MSWTSAKRWPSGALASAFPLLGKAYQDLHTRVQSPKMWVSVYDNACLVLSLYAKRAAGPERTAAETLLATLREYAHPPRTDQGRARSARNAAIAV